MAIDFKTTKPWCDIKDVTVDGQAMVWIPKFFLKTGKYESGAFKGKKYWLVSAKRLPGYHIHPAFVRYGVEKNGFYIGKYFACDAGNNIAGSLREKNFWNCETIKDARKACVARNAASTGEKGGWHLKTIYEWAAIQLLCLIEVGYPNMINAIGKGVSSSKDLSGTSSAIWRGICEMWGGTQEITDGIKIVENKFSIFKNTNNEEYVNTSVAVPDQTYLMDVADEKGQGYDCGDLFLPITTSDATKEVFCGEYHEDGICPFGKDNAKDTFNTNGKNLFSFARHITYCSQHSKGNKEHAFRIAKYDV